MKSVNNIVIAAPFILGAMLATHPASAQCTGTWVPMGFGPLGVNGLVRATALWDPDGPGSQLSRLLVAGNFKIAGGVPVSNIATWDGVKWARFAEDFSGEIKTILTWDVDGAGPLPPRIVVAGAFTRIGDTQFNGIAMWDGATWQPFGVGFDGDVLSLTLWDPDGPGAQPTQLIAGGAFNKSGTTTLNGVARWDGSAWLPLATGFTHSGQRRVHALAAWDPDGTGPLTQKLVAGGTFTDAGGIPVKNLAEWNGVEWKSTGGGTTGPVYALTSWDRDGTGPLTPRLAVGGQLTAVGSIAAKGVATWDGSNWMALCTAMTGSGQVVNSLLASGSSLVIGGQFETVNSISSPSVAYWDGSWQSYSNGINQGAPLRGAVVNALCFFDPDGTGTQYFTRLFAAGTFNNAGLVNIASVSSYDWLPLGSGSVRGFAKWDPDGDGPEREQLAIGGNFEGASGLPLSYITSFNGTQFVPLAQGVSGIVITMNTWDVDASGPLPPRLIVGGDIRAAPGSNTRVCRYWDGSQWISLPGYQSSTPVVSMAQWDPDGIGGETPRLAILSQSGISNLSASGSIAAMPNLGTSLRCVASTDGLLLVGGSTVSAVAFWANALGAWRAFGTGLSGTVYAMASWDSDGPGPLSARMYATNVDAFGTPGLWRFDGTSWKPFANVGLGYALTAWDPDGKGPAPERLVVGGNFESVEGIAARCVASWDGSKWSAFGRGIANNVYALTTFDPDGDGPLPARLIAGGNFAEADNKQIYWCAQWIQPFSPIILSQSTAASTCRGSTVSLSIDVQSEPAPAYQWQRETSQGSGHFESLTNGPQSSLGNATVAGATTRELVLSTLPAEANGLQFRVVATNTCGTTTSTPANLHVLIADLDCNGLVDDADVSLFITQYNLMLCDDPQMPTTCPADFNHDGLVDDADFSIFIPAYDIMIFR